MNAGCGSLCQESLDHLAAMNWCPVPQDQQPTGNVSEQVEEKVDDIGPLVGPLLHHHVGFTLGVMPLITERWSLVRRCRITGVLPVGA